MAAVYLKNLLLNFLSHSYDAGYCWEDLPSLCFGPGFPRSDFAFGSSRPIVTKAAKASRYEYGYLTLPAPTIPLPMTITTAPGGLELPFGGITKPGLSDVISSPGDYFSTGQLCYIFLVGMVSMWIGLMVNRFGNRGRASKSKAEIDRWAVAYQRLERESECGRKEQAERSGRQKRRLLRTLHSQQLRLGTKSRAMRDRLTRRYQRSLSRAQNEATGLRKELRKVQTKPATIDPNESHGLIAHLPWQYDHAKLIIIKQSSTITRTEAWVKFLQGRVDKFLLRQFHPDSAAHQLENDLKFRTKQLELMEKVNGMSVECMLDTFTNESALILVQMVRLENRIDALSTDNHVLQAKWQCASTLILQPRPTEAPVQPQVMATDEETLCRLVSQLSAVKEELRQARADLDAKADHRPESPSVDLERNEVNERLSLENFIIQESKRQLSSELCETKVKLGHVTRYLKDALLHDQPATMSKTHGSYAAEIFGDDSIQTALAESGSKAIRPARRSSVSQMERLQDITARPLAPLRRRSVSAATPISGADPTSPIPTNAESRSLREIVTMLRLVYGYGSSQPGQDGSGPPQDNGCDKEACSTPSQNGDGPGAEDDGTPSPYYGQRPTVLKGRTNRRRRKAEGVKDVETADAQ